MIRSRKRALVLAAFALLACEPEFSSSGSLIVDGQPFVPSSCHVLTHATGVELLDDDGDRLELTVPPRRIDAFASTSASATATFGRAEGSTVQLGLCGPMTLRGEGYHGQGKRALSGSLTLRCRDEAFRGELSFEGCF